MNNSVEGLREIMLSNNGELRVAYSDRKEVYRLLDQIDTDLVNPMEQLTQELETTGFNVANEMKQRTTNEQAEMFQGDIENYTLMRILCVITYLQSWYKW